MWEQMPVPSDLRHKATGEEKQVKTSMKSSGVHLAPVTTAAVMSKRAWYERCDLPALFALHVYVIYCTSSMCQRIKEGFWMTCRLIITYPHRAQIHMSILRRCQNDTQYMTVRHWENSSRAQLTRSVFLRTKISWTASSIYNNSKWLTDHLQ